MRIFNYQSDLGGLTYFLHCVKLLGGGTLNLIKGRAREPYTQEKVDNLKPILESQKYIKNVLYNESFKSENELIGNEIIDSIIEYDSQIEKALGSTYDTNEPATYAKFIGIKDYPQNESWLTCSNPKSVAEIVVARSPRAQNTTINWNAVLSNIDDIKDYHYPNINRNRNDAWHNHRATVVERKRQEKQLLRISKKDINSSNIVFVGYPEEHADFIDRFGYIPYYPTPTYYELFQVIAGCKTFCGNMSFPLALAIGLNVPKIVEETWPDRRDCKFNRPNMFYLD